MVGIVVTISPSLPMVSNVLDLGYHAVLQLVQDCCLSGSIKTDHENSHLLLPQKSVKQLRDCETHDGVSKRRSVEFEGFLSPGIRQ